MSFFDEVIPLIKSTNLPILTTGTLTVSLALQYGKPFIYEALRHQINFAKEINKILLNKKLSGRSLYVLGSTKEEKWQEEMTDFPNWIFERANNEYLKNAINYYRSKLAGGHLFDRIQDFCFITQKYIAPIIEVREGTLEEKQELYLKLSKEIDKK